MAVRIRMKKMGRRHRPFFRICAMDSRQARDGKVIEELGHYDPMVPETDARAVLKPERIDYWLGVGAQPTEKVKVLIRKYGTNGTHVEQQQQALERLTAGRHGPPQPVPAAAGGKRKPQAEQAEQAEPVEAAAESGAAGGDEGQ